jgi:phosphoribosylamine--glycine ligase
MNVLIIGSGGREHAFAWKISKSEKCENIFIAPGNAGTAKIGNNIDIGVNDFDSIAKAISEHNIDMLVVGPEDPLVNGIRDYFKSRSEFNDLMIIGPDAAGAQLEGSKDFSKIFMEENNIPTARSKTFTVSEIDNAYTYIDEQTAPIVIKADGLAAGKGVIIAQTKEDAKEAVKSMLVDKKFAEAGQKVLVEQFLDGIELSVFVLSDGENYKILPEAKDYKRIGEKDTGLNTGGMGAVSPVPFATDDFIANVEEKVVKPTLQGLNKMAIDYVGFIFIGLMNIDGQPYVIEYNVRMGDPETQVVLPRIKSDFLELLEATAKGKLSDMHFEIDEHTATTVVGVAGGYPEGYEKNNIITGLDLSFPQSTIFQAGTKQDGSDILTNGGRVIAVTGMGDDISSALRVSYEALEKISWKDIYYRKDIGQDILALGK